MTGEAALIRALRAIATDPAARALADDAAVLPFGNERLVLTLDTVVEGIHYLPSDLPADVAWKLVAVNVSDLSAKGAEPVGCLYSHALGEADWDQAFLVGLNEACRHFAIPLLGGDTVRMPNGSPRSFSLTALGRGPTSCPVPSRTAAKVGDSIWVTGTIGDAGLGLAAAANGKLKGADAHLNAVIARYRRPMPNPKLGIVLAPLVHAMMDVSDGLLVDAARIAEASGTALTIDAGTVPFSPALFAIAGDSLESRLAAMTAGDDYELLFTAATENAVDIQKIAHDLKCKISNIGTISKGSGLTLTNNRKVISLPQRLGYQH